LALLLVFLFVSVFFSFLCSILEAVLLSITPTFLRVKIKEGKGYAKTLEKLKADVDKPLIAILTLNTVAHTVGAIGVGAQAENVFPEGATFYGIPLIGIISALMTLVILIASEIIPKTIGATYWRSLAAFSTYTLDIMVKILKYTGILWLLQLTTKMVGKGSAHGSVFSRESMTVMAEIGEKEGVFNKQESTMIQNLMNFEDVLVKDIMTPRTVVVLSSATTTIQEFYDENPNLRFSRIPIYETTVDDITGFCLKDDILKSLVENKGENPLSSINRKIHAVDVNTPIPRLFETFMQQREHIAEVVDEFGGFQGIATLEDVLETLLGLEIMDEFDGIDDMRKLARKKWKQRAKGMGLKVEENG